MDERRFRVFQNRMLRRTFASKRNKWETKENYMKSYINPLNAKSNPICHLLALLGAHHILHISGVRVNLY
jgi:hypothetical protein